MSTYTIRCLCGLTSQRFGSKEAMRAWHADHKRKECVAVRRSLPTAASSLSAIVGRARPFDAELAALVERAKKLKPIVVPSSDAPTWTESAEWRDLSRDRWGAPGRGLLVRQWSSGNYLKACIASLLGAPIDRVPDPTVEFNEGLDGWIERYDKRLQAAIGHRLEVLPAHACPPRSHTQLWIACIRMDGPADHVVVARGNYVVHDPLGEFIGLLPMRRLVGRDYPHADGTCRARISRQARNRPRMRGAFSAGPTTPPYPESAVSPSGTNRCSAPSRGQPGPSSCLTPTRTPCE